MATHRYCQLTFLETSRLQSDVGNQGKKCTIMPHPSSFQVSVNKLKEYNNRASEPLDHFLPAQNPLSNALIKDHYYCKIVYLQVSCDLCFPFLPVSWVKGLCQNLGFQPDSLDYFFETQACGREPLKDIFNQANKPFSSDKSWLYYNCGQSPN